MERFRPGVLFFNRLVEKGWEVWVLDNYSVPGTNERTYDGQLLYSAKYAGVSEAAQTLGERLARTARALTASRAGLAGIEAVCAVPYFGGNRSISVPHILATSIAAELGIPDRSDLVSKVRETAPAKGAPAAVVDPSQFEARWTAPERRVLLVDDVYRSGGTLASLAQALQTSNLIPVAGIAALRAT